MYRKFVSSIQLFVCIAFMSSLDDQVSLPPSVGLSDETGLATMDGMPTFGESLPPSVADTDGFAMQSDHCEVGLPLPVEDIDGHASQSHHCEDDLPPVVDDLDWPAKQSDHCGDDLLAPVEDIDGPPAVDELPPDMTDSGSEFGTATKLADLCASLQHEKVEFQNIVQGPRHSVPTPAEVLQLRGEHLFAEYWSPPRCVPVALRLGMRCSLSLDIVTGWDFTVPSLRAISLQILNQLSVLFLMVCPPCTIFSDLMRLWNFKRMTLEDINMKWEEGMLHLAHSMQCCFQQWQAMRYFAFEHPERATSWQQQEVLRIQRLPGVECIVVDMCQFGLVSPVGNLPMRKRTRIMTNSPILVGLLQGKRCQGTHQHQLVMGSEGGVRLSTWAQVYPDAFCIALVHAAMQHANN